MIYITTVHLWTFTSHTVAVRISPSGIKIYTEVATHGLFVRSEIKIYIERIAHGSFHDTKLELHIEVISVNSLSRDGVKADNLMR